MGNGGAVTSEVAVKVAVGGTDVLVAVAVAVAVGVFVGVGVELGVLLAVLVGELVTVGVSVGSGVAVVPATPSDTAGLAVISNLVGDAMNVPLTAFCVARILASSGTVAVGSEPFEALLTSAPSASASPTAITSSSTAGIAMRRGAGRAGEMVSTAGCTSAFCSSH